MMAIRAVHETVLRLEAALKDAPPSERLNLIEQLVSYDEAAEALKHAYVHERVSGPRSLPPYEAIVSG